MQDDLPLKGILDLPPEKIAEIEKFVEFLLQKGVKAGMTEQFLEEEERASDLQAIAASIKGNTFTGNPPRFSREELHKRG